MVGGLKTTTSRVAIATAASLFAGGLALTPAQAADLGGDCCADLEERVAELEATTVRHGNRKVKLKLSGQVNSAIMYWDDGVDSDIYVIDSDEASSRMRLDAVGTIRPGLTAGLIIEYDLEVASGGVVTQTNDDGSRGVQLRRFNWFVKGAMGKLSIGQGGEATDGSFEVSFSNAWVAGHGYGLAVTNSGGLLTTGVNAATGGALSWYAFGTDNDGGRTNRIRYDSPTFAGFTLSASWGEDDDTGVALRYAKEFNGVKVAAALSYRDQDPDLPGSDTADQETYGGSIAFLFSNVHVQGGYSTREFNAVGVNGLSNDHWWIAAGYQFRGSDLGTTDITATYIANDFENAGVVGGNAIGGEYTSYGIGIAQNIDAVGGTLYLAYTHNDIDSITSTTAAGVTTNIVGTDDMDQILFGMRLRY